MIEWIKQLSNDLMPEATEEEEYTAKEYATSRVHHERANELGKAIVRLAQRGIHNPTLAEIFDERDRARGIVINVDLHEEGVE